MSFRPAHAMRFVRPGASPYTAAPQEPQYDLENRLGWILDEHLVARVPGTRAAVLLSGDGIRRAHSQGLTTQQAEPLAAAGSGMQSLARGYGKRVLPAGADEWEETIVSYKGGFLLLVGAGDNSYLVVHSDKDVDLATLTTAAHTCVVRLGENLATPLRDDEGSSPS